jgi:ADP-ribose pyrophosphatase YjhB (NUDIX family)
MNENTILYLAKRIKAIADTGLLYVKDDYDRDRYHELLKISSQFMSSELKVTPTAIESIFNNCVDYPTPKVDVRAMVLNSNNKILMVQEKADHLWSLPGGWAEIGKTASEVAVQEVLEETGLEVTCKYLSAVFDKRMHPHPPEPFYIYKMIFYCQVESPAETVLTPAFDIAAAAWFAIDALPPFSTDRILASQIQAVYTNIMKQHFITIFD